MAASRLFTNFLPYGKRYHVFFFHGHSTRDREWTEDVIKGIESHGYVGGCNSFDFDSRLSVFENHCLKCDQSIILAFIISQESAHSKTFNRMLETTLKYSMDKDEDKPTIPILLDDCKCPPCLLHLTHLCAFDHKARWWKTLLKVLKIEIPSSSSGESDEELREVHELMRETLMRKGMRQQQKFKNLCRKSGIAYYTSQTGSKSMHISLLKGCGVEMLQKKLVLEWDTFENVMRRSPETLNKIVHFNQECLISEITINFTEEGRDEFCRGFQYWRSELLQFLEHSLNYELNKGDYDRITYNVRFRGQAYYEMLHLANNLVRNIYLQNFLRRSSEFDDIEKRIETFENSPYSDERILNFARAGFIYSGTPDTITCYSCNQSIFGKLGLSETELILSHIEWNSDCEHLRKNYNISKCKINNSIDPYEPPKNLSTFERWLFNSYYSFNIPIDTARLAHTGFIITPASGRDIHAVCTACSYHDFIHTLDELEKNHLLWSGENCPILVKEIGLQAIKKFRKDHEFRIQHISSITLQTIMMRKSLQS